MARTFRMARLFDVLDPVTGPSFAPDHPREHDAEEIERLLGFLYDGAPLIAAIGRAPDLVEPSRGERVPIATMTDGVWIWSGGHAYYLETYGIALDPEFHEHIRQQRYRAKQPDQRTLDEAMAYLEEQQAG